MGNSCSPCCKTCVQKICCCSPCCKTPPITSVERANKATSPIARLLRTVGTVTNPRPPSPPPPTSKIPPDFTIKTIRRQKIDVSSLDEIVRNANFTSIVNEDFSLDIDEQRISTKKKATSKTDHDRKKTRATQEEDADWKEQYFVHGMFSDIVADVTGHIHGCFNSSISEDIDINFAILHEINTKAAAILNDRRSKIAAAEKSLIDRFIHQRDELIQVLLEDSCLYANKYEEQYRRVIEEFIKILEIEMSKQLDYLQSEIEEDKQSIFRGINTNIDRITAEADKARNAFHQIIQITAARKRQEIMQKIDVISKDKTKQTLGYEQIRNVKVDIYSTTGVKTDDNCCEQIVTRKKFIKDITKSKLSQPSQPSQSDFKRTVYLGSTLPAQQTNRPNP